MASTNINKKEITLQRLLQLTLHPPPIAYLPKKGSVESKFKLVQDGEAEIDEEKKNKGGGGRLVCRKSFSTHGHQSARIIPQTFLSPTLNGITYVVRHEKLIHWSRGNVKGNDLRSSLPP